MYLEPRHFSRLALAFAVSAMIALLPARPAAAQEVDASREFTNPISSFVFFVTENNSYWLDGDITDSHKYANVQLIDPAFPIPIGDTGWTAVTRPIVPIITTADVPTAPSIPSSGVLPGIGGSEGTIPSPPPGGFPGLSFDNVAGLGDLTLFSLLSPPNQGAFKYAFGATTRFPTATDDALGGDTWQLGPAALAMYTQPQFTVGALFQHWWDYAGDGPDVDSTSIQYFYNIPLNERWSIGAGPVISINWEQDGDERWSVPLGTGLSYQTTLFDRPTRFIVEGDYYGVRPDSYGAEWQFRVVVAVMLGTFEDVFGIGK